MFTSAPWWKSKILELAAPADCVQVQCSGQYLPAGSSNFSGRRFPCFCPLKAGGYIIGCDLEPEHIATQDELLTPMRFAGFERVSVDSQKFAIYWGSSAEASHEFHPSGCLLLASNNVTDVSKIKTPLPKMDDKLSDHLRSELFCLELFVAHCGTKFWLGLEWIAGPHLSPDALRSFNPFQRANHFPNSWQLGRKAGPPFGCADWWSNWGYTDTWCFFVFFCPTYLSFKKKALWISEDINPSVCSAISATGPSGQEHLQAKLLVYLSSVYQSRATIKLQLLISRHFWHFSQCQGWRDNSPRTTTFCTWPKRHQWPWT